MPDGTVTMRPDRRRKIRKILATAGLIAYLVIVIIVSIIVVRQFGNLIDNPAQIRSKIEQAGFLGYVLFVILNIFQIIFAPVPGHFLTVSSGFLFGPFKGIIVNWISVIIGGSIAILISRLLGKKAIEILLDDKAERFEKIITARGIPFIFLLATLPNPIGDTLFYLVGLTNIPFSVLVVVIALGRLPGTIVAVLIGDTLLMTGLHGWMIAGIGLVLIIILYVLFGRFLEDYFEKIIRRYFWRKEQ